MSTEITPFDPTIPKEEVDRLFRKLGDTRLPSIPVVPDAGDDYGKSGRAWSHFNPPIPQYPLNCMEESLDLILTN